MRPSAIPAAVSEFELIERIRRRAGGHASVRLGIGDDAAVIEPTPGRQWVATTDSLIADRHFTADWSPADVGHLAMHANLSDLAAMGALPRWALLALTLPVDDADWLDAFLDGFLGAAEAAGVVLAGGNLARGPLNIGVQLLGEVAADGWVSRRGAVDGDCLVVTGTLGDAAAALALGENAGSDLRQRLRRPEARVRAGQALAATAHAMIDLSDGLAADLAHLLEAGGAGADVRLAALPASSSLSSAVGDRMTRWRYQTGGGSDYELLAALPPEAAEHLDALAQRAGVALTVIGRVRAGGRLRFIDEDGAEISGLGRGWDHFDHE